MLINREITPLHSTDLIVASSYIILGSFQISYRTQSLWDLQLCDRIILFCLTSSLLDAMRRAVLPPESLEAWARLNGAAFSNIAVRPLQGRGLGVVSTADIDQAEGNVLMLIPRDLVLSQELVWEFAKSDHHLRAVLESVGDFARVCASYLRGD